jgi:general secretion pathway protein G
MAPSASWHAEPARAQRWAARGFTLIEMVIVVAIVGILATAAHPMLTLLTRRQHELELRQGLRTLRTAIDAYKQATASGQVKVGADDSGYPPNLQVLVDGVPDARLGGNRKIYFLRRLPRDPYADPSLPAARSWALRSYDSPPDAPRPGRDVFDVHASSTGTGLDGTAYQDW